MQHGFPALSLEKMNLHIRVVVKKQIFVVAL